MHHAAALGVNGRLQIEYVALRLGGGWRGPASSFNISIALVQAAGATAERACSAGHAPCGGARGEWSTAKWIGCGAAQRILPRPSLLIGDNYHSGPGGWVHTCACMQRSACITLAGAPGVNGRLQIEYVALQLGGGWRGPASSFSIWISLGSAAGATTERKGSAGHAPCGGAMREWPTAN